VSTIAELRQVSHRYGSVRALDGVNLRLEEGEILSILGPSGCGKSTLLRLIAGLEANEAGTILLGGEEASRPGRAVPPEHRRVGLVFQDYALFPHLSILDNVMFGMRNLPREQARNEALALLERVGLASRAQGFPHTLSGGEQQRVALARSIAPRPRLLLMDEPFAGLDTALRASVRRETVEVLGERGCSAIIVTHDPEEAMEISDRILVLRAGRVEQEGTPEQIYFEPGSAFVARFFGTSSTLWGATTAACEVRCGPFRFHTANARFADQLDAGQAAEIVVRSEAVRLQLPGGAVGDRSSEELIDARVRSVRWTSGGVRLELDLGGSAESNDVRAERLTAVIPAWQWRSRSTESAQTVCLGLEPSGVHVFRG
jgi:iron(III) transport system ATP-binding protein